VIVGVPGEPAPEETRVALVPDAAEEFREAGHDVLVAAGAGEGAGWPDAAYREVDATVVDDRSEVFERADVVLRVEALGAAERPELDAYRDGQVVVGLLGPYDVDDETLAALAERDVTAFALELMPRIGRAQSMDALSSMANVAGYKAAVMAADELPKMFPLQMTAAGTLRPADVFVIGAGVAGLKAIATADRLGAAVKAYDIRLEVREEVESLGADFVELDLETEGSGDEEGYAREMDDEFLGQQRKELSRVVPESDVVITTAAIPGRPAPELVSTEMVEGMAPGSVVVDVSAGTGGNCEVTRPGETISHDGVTVFGPTNLPSAVPKHASRLYANNLVDFVENLLEDGALAFDVDDEIVDATMLTHDGTVRAPHRDDETAEADANGDEPDEETEASEQEATTDDD
jgi:NAD(P) transhydrogenase subunit alpha